MTRTRDHATNRKFLKPNIKAGLFDKFYLGKALDCGELQKIKEAMSDKNQRIHSQAAIKKKKPAEPKQAKPNPTY